MLRCTPTSALFLVGSAILAFGCGDSGSTSSGTGGSSSNTDGSTGGGTTSSAGGGGGTTTNGTGGSTTNGAGGGLEFTAGDCVTECQQGQATDGCTTLTGDCQNCCDAAVSLAPKSMCEAEFNAYYACISGPADPCNPTPVDCTNEQGGLTDCAKGYCLEHQADPDCGTLIGCFQMGNQP